MSEVISSLTDFPSSPGLTDYLQRIRSYVESLGVRVVDDFTVPDQARFIGIFEGHTITLFPGTAPSFALWFTVAHLFGHMTQMAGKNSRVNRANALVLRRGETLSSSDVQLIYDHEYEAAEIGRALVAAAEPGLPGEMDVAYSRLFLADFRYLINVIETDESGPAAFEKSWRREPTPRELDKIKADSRPLLNMRNVPPSTETIVVV